MFNGEIIRAGEYFRRMGKSYGKNDIPWIAWGGQRPEWQYTTSTRYCGTMGGWLLNKLGSDNWYYVTEQPNDAAFAQMENFTSRPRGLTRGARIICSVCTRGFRGDDPEQETCQKCLVNALNIALNKAHEADEEKKRVAQQYENILDQMKGLEGKLEAVENSKNIVVADLEEAKSSLAETNTKVVNLASEIESLELQIDSEIERKKGVRKILKAVGNISSKQARLANRLFQAESKTALVEIEKDSLKTSCCTGKIF